MGKPDHVAPITAGFGALFRAKSLGLTRFEDIATFALSAAGAASRPGDELIRTVEAFGLSTDHLRARARTPLELIALEGVAFGRPVGHDVRAAQAAAAQLKTQRKKGSRKRRRPKA